MYNRILAIIIVFVASFTISNAQDEVSSKRNDSTANIKKMITLPEDVARQSDLFFKTLIQGKTNEAYKKLLAGSSLTSKDNDIKNLVDQTIKAWEIYGEIKDYELVSIDRPANSLLKASFLGVCVQYPMRWIITYYKSPNLGWIVVNVKFDDQSEEFFK